MHRFLPITALLLLAPAAFAQTGYKLPPPEVVALVDAPVPKSTRFSPDHRYLLLGERDALPSIEELSRRMLRLAGMRIDPAANGSFRTGYERKLWLQDLKSFSAPVAVGLPEGSKIGSADWSHNGTLIAVQTIEDEGTDLWVVSVDAPDRPRRVARGLNGVLGRSATWMPDGTSLLCLLVPATRGAEPAAPRVPRGPNVQETSGSTAPIRTYQDLLSSPHDEALFEHFATSQIAIVPADGGPAAPIGAPALHSDVDVSPDGRFLLVSRIHRPYSWLFPASSFPETVEVWDRSAKSVRLVAEVPLGDNIPMEGVRTGPRSIGWRPGTPATLVWAEALDGGDPKREAEHRDRWLTLSAPFDGEPLPLLKTVHRARGLQWCEQPGLVFASDYDRDRRWTRTWLHFLDTPGKEPKLVEDRNVRDRYGDPGSFLTKEDATGRRLVRQEGPWVYRSGSGSTAEGDLPFLDRQNLETLETERLWRCEKGSYESVVDLLAATPLTVVTRHESPESPPNLWIRIRGEGGASGDIALTSDPDPTPQIRGIKKELVTYDRADGVKLSATLYLPADWKAGTRLPLFLWAYPLEYTDPATAGQVSGSPWRFTRIAGSSQLHLVTQGWAVMDGATMPVVGDPETMNDTFRDQIVSSAKAAIDKAVSMGVADRDRVAVGGHSYGAFMTANLLAHCDLFRAGVARSGAYNRTLTPFGFQSERRTIWEAPKAYTELSPFFFAHKIRTPLLMIHGEADNNSGTFPIQSERLYQAIKGNGGTARLVMLPHESHGYQARESVLHMLAETIEWLDEHVKSVPRAKASEASTAR